MCIITLYNNGLPGALALLASPKPGVLMNKYNELVKGYLAYELCCNMYIDFKCRLYTNHGRTVLVDWQSEPAKTTVYNTINRFD